MFLSVIMREFYSLRAKSEYAYHTHYYRIFSKIMMEEYKLIKNFYFLLFDQINSFLNPGQNHHVRGYMQLVN